MRSQHNDYIILEYMSNSSRFKVCYKYNILHSSLTKMKVHLQNNFNNVSIDSDPADDECVPVPRRRHNFRSIHRVLEAV